jgi:CDP-diacylglycerol--glycerol-3-phosphate 3-phosphatidyltransferase
MTVVWNAPNTISALRLACIPVLIAALVTGDRTLFTWVLVPALVSDILDGLLARLLEQRTEAGAVLDSTADLLLTLAGVAGILRFEPDVVRAHAAGLGSLAALYTLNTALAIMKYGGLAGFHTWGCRTAAYAQGFWIGSLFVWGFVPWLYAPMLSISWLAWLEEAALILTLRRPVRDARGLWWVMRRRVPAQGRRRR